MLKTLSNSLHLPKIPSWLALVQQQFYGCTLHSTTIQSTSVDVQFKTLVVSEVAIELNVRCAGLEFKLQLVDPDALFELGGVFMPGVPLHLQAAAFFYAAQPVWKAVEKIVGLPIHFVSVSGKKAAVSSTQGLGMVISINDKLNGETRKSDAVIQALQPEGWQTILAGARSKLVSNGEQIDLHLVLSIVIENISIAWCELMQAAVGDVLLLDLAAKTLGSESLHLELGTAPIAGVKAKRDGNRLQITQVTPVAEHKTALYTENIWTETMTIDDNEKEAFEDEFESSAEAYQSALDNMVVDVRLELGRLSLPISVLRKLAIGQIFDTQKPLDGESVLLSCGGQQLGVGQLIAIGERIGVRIIALQLQPGKYKVDNYDGLTGELQLPSSSPALYTD